MKTFFKVFCMGLLSVFIPKLAVAQSTSYSVNYNDPYDIKPLKVNLLVLTLDGYGINAGIGAGLHAQYVLGKVFTIEALGKYSYFSLSESGKKTDEMKSGNSFQKPLYLEGGVEWHFSDRMVDRKLTMNLATDGNLKTNMRVPIKARKIYALRGGLFTLQSSVFGSDDGIMFMNNATRYGDNYVTTARTGGVYAGISTRRIDKASIKTDDYGSRRRNRNRSLFADVMFSATSFDDLQEKSSNASINIKETETKNIGWRVGGQWMDNGTYVRMELGQLPTVKTQLSAYLSFTFGFTVYGNEKEKRRK
ncbi:MAG: hypothetical protein ACXWEY_03410 [Bacteroidia bacterium]